MIRLSSQMAVSFILLDIMYQYRLALPEEILSRSLPFNKIAGERLGAWPFLQVNNVLIYILR
jgi:hypothetical protein